GDFLVLSRQFWHGPEIGGSTFGVDALMVNELGPDGLLAAQVIFEPKDMEAAVAELEQRFLSGEGAEFAHVWQVVVEAHAAWNARDFERFNETATDDMRFVDHRLASFGEMRDRDRLRYFQSVIDVTPNLIVNATTIHILNERGTVYELLTSAKQDDGALIESTYLYVSVMRGSQVETLEIFPVDELDEAMMRFR